VQNNGNSSYNSSVLDENCSGDDNKMKSDSRIFAITNQNFDMTRNIEAWRINVIKEKEERKDSKRTSEKRLLVSGRRE